MADKLGRRDQVMRVANILRITYGFSLTESDTDILLADAVVSSLEGYLDFSEHEMSTEDFEEWKRQRLQD